MTDIVQHICRIHNNPFGTPWLMFADSVRVLCMLGGAWIIGYAIRLATIVRNTRQWGIWGAVFMAASVIYTEFIRLGDTVTIRLWLNLVGVTLFAIYLYKMYRHIAELEDVGETAGLVHLAGAFPTTSRRIRWYEFWLVPLRKRNNKRQ